MLKSFPHFWHLTSSIFWLYKKSVKLEKYVKFDDIFEAIESGNDNGLEAMIKQIIEDYEEEDEEE